MPAGGARKGGGSAWGSVGASCVGSLTPLSRATPLAASPSYRSAAAGCLDSSANQFVWAVAVGASPPRGTSPIDDDASVVEAWSGLLRGSPSARGWLADSAGVGAGTEVSTSPSDNGLMDPFASELSMAALSLLQPTEGSEQGRGEDASAGPEAGAAAAAAPGQGAGQETGLVASVASRFAAAAATRLSVCCDQTAVAGNSQAAFSPPSRAMRRICASAPLSPCEGFAFLTLEHRRTSLLAGLAVSGGGAVADGGDDRDDSAAYGAPAVVRGERQQQLLRSLRAAAQQQEQQEQQEQQQLVRHATAPLPQEHSRHVAHTAPRRAVSRRALLAALAAPCRLPDSFRQQLVQQQQQSDGRFGFFTAASAVAGGRVSIMTYAPLGLGVDEASSSSSGNLQGLDAANSGSSGGLSVNCMLLGLLRAQLQHQAPQPQVQGQGQCQGEEDGWEDEPSQQAQGQEAALHASHTFSAGDVEQGSADQ